MYAFIRFCNRLDFFFTQRLTMKNSSPVVDRKFVKSGRIRYRNKRGRTVVEEKDTCQVWKWGGSGYFHFTDCVH